MDTDCTTQTEHSPQKDHLFTERRTIFFPSGPIKMGALFSSFVPSSSSAAKADLAYAVETKKDEFKSLCWTCEKELIDPLLDTHECIPCHIKTVGSELTTEEIKALVARHVIKVEAREKINAAHEEFKTFQEWSKTQMNLTDSCVKCQKERTVYYPRQTCYDCQIKYKTKCNRCHVNPVDPNTLVDACTSCWDEIDKITGQPDVLFTLTPPQKKESDREAGPVQQYDLTSHFFTGNAQQRQDITAKYNVRASPAVDLICARDGMSDSSTLAMDGMVFPSSLETNHTCVVCKIPSNVYYEGTICLACHIKDGVDRRRVTPPSDR